MTIQITRGSNSFEYRQREDEPNVLEWRSTYRGARWQFIGRFATPEQAQAALLDIEADWRQVAAGAEEEGKP